MHSKLSVTHLKSSPTFRLIPYHHENFSEIKRCSRNFPSSSSSSDHKFRFRIVGLFRGDNRWKLNAIDGTAVQETLNQWLSKTQDFLNEVTSPLVKTVHDRKPTPGNMFDTQDKEDIFMAEQTIDSRTPNGNLSLAAVVSIEQFSRMNGLTGLKMQKIFKALVPEAVYNDARNLVEYCCFRFLSRDGSEIHPCLKEPAFRRLIFITMLAWEKPYSKRKDPRTITSEKASFQRRRVREEAFVRIAPAISGVADRSTAHSLFKALAGDEHGISFNTWSTYMDELLKVHEGRKLYEFEEGPQHSSERILCLGSSRKRPVLKWENNNAWPGKLTLTDKALYFEGVGLGGQKGAVRLDLTKHGTMVEKTRVGPLGFDLFDSAVSVSAGAESKTWVLEFIDLGGEMRRDVWYAFICEIIALYKFMREFGPEDGDQLVYNVYGSHKGKVRATTYAINSIARLQALQFMRKTLEDPIKLVQFSYLQSAPYGDVVCQTLAVNCWGGQLVTKFTEGGYVNSNEVSESSNHVFDIDGSLYLWKWMRSPSWASSASVAFWKNASVRRGVVLSKNLVVAGMTLVEKAAITCREKHSEVEKTQATIYAAMLEGIPSNIDLFKELVLPLTITGNIPTFLLHFLKNTSQLPFSLYRPLFLSLKLVVKTQMAPELVSATTKATSLVKAASLTSRAYVTFLAGNGDYVKGVVGLAKGLRKVKTAYPLVVAVLPDVPEEHRRMLLAQGCIVREIKPVYPPANQTQFAMAYYVINYSKLRIWEFVEYHKMIYLDGDIQVFENIDHLFDNPNGYFYAVKDCFCEKTWSHTPQYQIGYCQQCPDKVQWPRELGPKPPLYFNAGMFVFEPSLPIYDDLLETLKITPPTPFAEQDFLNMFFRDVYKPIPPIYNLVLAMLWRHPENIELNKVRVVHYCAAGSKPWRYTGIEENMKRKDIKMLVKRWWDIYNDESLDFKKTNISPIEGEADKFMAATVSEANAGHYITAPSAA